MSAAAPGGSAAAPAGAAGTGGSTAAPALGHIRVENLAAPIACVRCGQVRPPVQWVAVAPNAAAAYGPTCMAPVCAVCVLPSAPDERPLSHV